MSYVFLFTYFMYLWGNIHYICSPTNDTYVELAYVEIALQNYHTYVVHIYQPKYDCYKLMLKPYFIIIGQAKQTQKGQIIPVNMYLAFL